MIERKSKLRRLLDTVRSGRTPQEADLLLEQGLHEFAREFVNVGGGRNAQALEDVLSRWRQVPQPTPEQVAREYAIKIAVERFGLSREQAEGALGPVDFHEVARRIVEAR